MREIAIISLLALLVACADEQPVAPDDAVDIRAAKGGIPGPPDKGGGEEACDGGYCVIDLGALAGRKTSSWGRDISGLQDGMLWVVGTSEGSSGDSMATYWTVNISDGEAAPSGPYELPGGTGGAYGVSKSGTYAAGYLDVEWEAPTPVRWSWSGSGWQSLLLEDERSSGARSGVARDVNDAGVAVGLTAPPSGTPIRQATIWTSQGPQELPTLTDGVEDYSYARAINENGYVVGMSAFDPDPDQDTGHFFHAVLWMPNQDGSYEACDLHIWGVPQTDPPWYGQVLHSHAWGASHVYQQGGSEFVKVAGSRTLYGGEGRATTWTIDVADCGDGMFAGQWEDLGTASASDINVSGQAVGADHSAGRLRPVTWTIPGGTAFVVLPSLSGDYGKAEGINGTGWIVGWTKAGGKPRHAVLWMEKQQ